MDADEFRRRGREMVDYIADYMEHIHERRVLPEVQPGYLRELLPNKAPQHGESWNDIWKDVENAIMIGITHWQHPRFHAYFPAGNSYPSILGDMLSDALGIMGFSWAASPACTELEIIVLDWLAKMIGLPPIFWHEQGNGGGVIQGSASECVLVSLLAARHSAITELRKTSPPEVADGVLLSKLVAYCSKLAHSCVEKAGMIGMVKMHELDVDDDYSLRGTTLQTAIENDRKRGLIPFYVCACLGSTAVCSFDNINELGAICRKENLWFHVDAAYAGSALVCPEFQPLIKGIEFASSFNMNPNKWMLINFDCSTMWVRNKIVLTTALTVDPLYLRHSADNATDFRHWGIPLSRRFRALKIWFVLRSYGVHGIQKYIREHCRLAKLFERLVKNDDRFLVLGKVAMGLVCFRLKGPNYRTQTLLRALNVSGKIHMVPALLGDDYVIRFAVCAQNATESDITYAWSTICETAATVLAACDLSTDASIEEELEKLECEDENGETAMRAWNSLGSDDDTFGEDDDVFLYDNNIPSIPSIPVLTGDDDGETPVLSPHRRRNKLLRMISDPKCYNPKIISAMSINNKRHRSETSKYVPRGGSFYFGTAV